MGTEERNGSVRRGTYHAVSKTDLGAVIRYLDDAAAFYCRHGAKAKDQDRARLLRRLGKKLKKIMENNNN